MWLDQKLHTKRWLSKRNRQSMVAFACLDPRQPEMGRDWLGMIRRGMKKPPRYIVQRIIHEVYGQAERHVAPRRALQLSATVLAQRAGYSSTAQWWDALATLPCLAQ